MPVNTTPDYRCTTCGKTATHAARDVEFYNGETTQYYRTPDPVKYGCDEHRVTVNYRETHIPPEAW